MSVHFLYFLSKWRGVKPTSISNKYVENEISNSASLKKKRKKREEQKHDLTSQTSFLKLLKICP